MMPTFDDLKTNEKKQADRVRVNNIYTYMNIPVRVYRHVSIQVALEPKVL
jgi:hypothetical protein